MMYRNYKIFWKISLAVLVVVEIVDLTLRAVIDSFDFFFIILFDELQSVICNKNTSFF